MDVPADTPREETSYELHGDEIDDPYLWLEEDSETVDTWVDAQNELADSFLHDIPVRADLEPVFDEYARTMEYGSIVARPTGYFQSVEHPEDDQPVLTYRAQIDDERDVIVDPNDWSDDGTISMGWWSVDSEGDRLAYAIDEGGEEQFDMAIIDPESGDEIDELVDLGRSMQPAWVDDGIYYVETGGAEEGTQLEKRVRYHRFGTDQADDPLLRETDEPSRWPAPVTDREGDHLLLVETVDWDRTELWYASVDDGELEPLLVDTESLFHPLIHEDTLYLRTNHDADRYRVLTVDLDGVDLPIEPGDMTELIPEREGILKSVTIAGDHLLAHYHEDVVSAVEVYDLDGTHETSASLPGTGTVTGLSGNRDADEGFLIYESFDHPSAVYRLDPGRDSLDELDRVDIDPDLELTIEQQWFESADGTEVPMFVVHRRDLSFDEPVPTLLYGYGGYEISLTPGYPTFGIEFLRAGGVFAQVNLRGGGEFGKQWHHAARHDRKQRTFDDMIAAAESLIESGYTASDRLAIRGGSNGGLTVGAVMTQRPDLVESVVCEVPLLDMLRFHRFLLGSSWTSEYGSPDDPQAYEWIKAYSPYHNLEERSYPDVLFKTAEGDTRVHPVHAWKMTARMQELAEDTMVLCKTNRDTGHGTGKPTWMIVEEALDVWSFLFDRLDLSY